MRPCTDIPGSWKLFIAWRYEFSPEGLVKTSSEESWQNPYATYRKKPFTGNFATGLLIVLVIAQFFFNVREEKLNQVKVEASEASLAIVPFTNNTGDAEKDFIGIGFASEVGTSLAVSKEFDFISSLQATLKYQGTHDSPSKIGNELGVTHLITGMYQTAGPDIHVLVELVEVATDRVIWNLPIRSKFEDAFKIQTDIAAEVMKRFEVNKAVEKNLTSNMEAYALFSRIENEDDIIGSGTPIEALEALPTYKRVIAMDSTFVDAWVAAIVSQTFYHTNFPDDTVVTPEKIEPYLNYVNEHFPDAWQKDLANGIYHYQVLKEFDTALEFLFAALEKNPESRRANSFVSYVYKRRFDNKTAIKYLTKAIQIRPAYVVSWNELVQNFRLLGDHENEGKACLMIYNLNKNNMFQLINFKRRHNDLESLPPAIKQAMGKTYIADSLLFRRKLNELIQFADTVSIDTTFSALSKLYYSALANNLLKNDELARTQASEYLSILEKDDEARAPFIGGFGFARRSMEALSGIPPKPYSGRKGQDMFVRLRERGDELVFLTMNGRYEEATAKLREINEEHPQIASYNWVRNSPTFDRIKQEHPAFNDAVNNLKIPIYSPVEEIIKL
jgi:TolB-like protein